MRSHTSIHWLVSLAFLLASGLAGTALAQGSIELKASAEKEVTTTGSDGVEKVDRVEASIVTPGEDVIYTITATNVGNAPTEDVVITDPIPGDMTYLEGTAGGDTTEVTFSVDGGQSYDSPDDLIVVNGDGQPRPAEPGDYTHVRFELEGALEPGASESVEFRARLN